MWCVHSSTHHIHVNTFPSQTLHDNEVPVGSRAHIMARIVQKQLS